MATPKISTPKSGKRPNEINESDRSWLESFGMKRSLTDYEQEARDAPLKETAEASEKSSDGYSMSKEELDVTMKSLKKLYNSLESKPKKELTEVEKELIKLLDTYKAAGTGTGFLNKLQKAATDTSKPTTKEEPQVDNSTKTEEPKTTNSENAEEVKTDNSGTTEETVTPEPEAKAEQAQTTQEPAKETNARPGTGEASKDNIMSPEDAFKFFNDKNNYERASTVFKTPSFDEYIDTTTGKWIPRSYFDAFNARDGINPKNFTFEHFKAKIPEDPGKPLTAEEKTADIYNKTKAAQDYDKEYEKYNTGFKAYLRRHPKLAKMLKTGGALGALYGLGQLFNDTYMAGQNDKDELQNIRDSLDDDEPEYPGFNGNNANPGDIAAQLKDADASTETPEGDLGTIAQVAEQQAPTDNAAPEGNQVAANASTPASTAANTAEPAPTQGLPPAVTRDAPPANAGSSDMPNNPSKPNDVTAALANAMKLANSVNPEPQAGSISYEDLYDQNFIDYWAKSNPNLAYAVSQRRKS